jgi:hypothetical protein
LGEKLTGVKVSVHPGRTGHGRAQAGQLTLDRL